jgi:hypothetical protein
MGAASSFAKASAHNFELDKREFREWPTGYTSGSIASTEA